MRKLQTAIPLLFLFLQFTVRAETVTVTKWTPFTMNIGATVVAPTKATTPDVDNAIWRRVGDTMEINYVYYSYGGVGSAVGTGTYLFSLPTGFSVNTTKVPVSVIPSPNSIVGIYSDCSAKGDVWAYNATQLAVRLNWSGTYFDISSAFFSLIPQQGYKFIATVPIQGWTTRSNDREVVTIEKWQRYSPLPIGGSTTAPTKATTPVVDYAYRRRVGDTLNLRGVYAHTNNAGTAAGAGTYLFQSPEVMSSALPVDAACERAAFLGLGTATFSGSGLRSAPCTTWAYSTTTIAMDCRNAYTGSPGILKDGMITSSTFAAQFDVSLPIANWTTFQ